MSKQFTWNLALSGIYLSILLGLFVLFNPSPNSGDSALHFLYAKWSWVHLGLFFEHWAKPFFTLVASPFAQFGFEGIVFFNILLSAGSVLALLSTIRPKDLFGSFLMPTLFLTAPLVFRLTFSGLTEYLFGFFLSLALYATVKKKHLFSALLISCLPMIRSEGLIILIIWGLWWMINRRYYTLLLLPMGTLMFSIAGLYVHEDPLWLFTKIPYAKLSSTYGEGSFIDFFHHLAYVFEKPQYILLLLGFLACLIRIGKTGPRAWLASTEGLVVVSFASYFGAHALFWELGIFNSMGLPRVLIAIAPFGFYTMWYGINWVADLIEPRWSKLLLSVVFIALIIYPFTPRIQGVEYHAEMFMVPENESFDAVIKPLVLDVDPSLKQRRLVYHHPYISVSLGIDHFDESRRMHLAKENLSALKSEDLVIWDNWFSVIEGGVTLEDLTIVGFSEIKRTPIAMKSPIEFVLLGYSDGE